MMHRSPNRPALQSPVLAIVTLILLLAVSACGSPSETSTDDPGTSIRVVEPVDASELLDDGTDRILIDVRTPEEFDEARLDGALLIDFYRDDFEAAIDELDRDQAYVIYCRSGNRSGQAREIMAQLGFTDVADIDGGILAWDADGLPTVR